MSLEEFGATTQPSLREIHTTSDGTITCPVSGDSVAWTAGELEIPVVHLTSDNLQRKLRGHGIETLRSRGYRSHKHEHLMPETCEGRAATTYSAQFVGIRADLGTTVAWIPIRKEDLPEDIGLKISARRGENPESTETVRNDPSSSTNVGHCQHDGTDVYVGRHGPNGQANLLNTEIGDPGWLGNPYPVDVFGREQAVAMFTETFLLQLEERPVLRRAVYNLRGQVLGCWCQRLEEESPVCHAEVIASAADRLIRPAQGGDRDGW